MGPFEVGVFHYAFLAGRGAGSDAPKTFIIKQREDGTQVAEICRKAGISKATQFIWRNKYTSLLPTELKLTLPPPKGKRNPHMPRPSYEAFRIA
ncbi:transposase [Tabrizicola sp. KVB23]|uniref:Transposase n=1 Tax=Fuscibacter oryzae TaxID=2803939 RepID=A0A8J7MTQ8_9RHOB|nr:transposase [Fuscibacter oryzae]